MLNGVRKGKFRAIFLFFHTRKYQCAYPDKYDGKCGFRLTDY